ncbi:hypothetical protein ACFL3I_04480 [Pseudomonadota bacterium]
MKAIRVYQLIYRVLMANVFACVMVAGDWDIKSAAQAVLGGHECPHDDRF